MAIVNTNSNREMVLPQQLLGLLTEDLKTPLSQIARLSELAALDPDGMADVLTEIRNASEMALKLADNYALGLKLANFEPGTLALEPVAASGLLSEVVGELKPLAASYGVKLELELSGHYLPVITNAKVLTAALASAGVSLLEAIAGEDAGRVSGQASLKLCLHRSTGGAEAGWYWDEPKINSEIITRARGLTSSRQPLALFTSSSASGIFIADLLLDLMGSELKTSKFRNLSGLAAGLKTSSQLALI